MIATGVALGSERKHLAPADTVGGIASLDRALVYCGCVLLALVTNYLLGKDLAWDTLNYHLYAGFSAVHNRFGQDFFAAGPQSYFNPYAYVPFYAMVSAGFSALEISSVLALVHSAVLCLTFELGLCVCPSSDRLVRLACGLGAVGLAYVNPILMQQIGSTFADITTTILVLSGWLLLARAVSSPRALRGFLYAGLLLGAATALKPTNAVHAVSAVAVLIALPRTWYGRLRHGLGYGLALAFGFFCVSAPWSYRLWHAFRNPFFPLMNSVFRSPQFTTERLLHYRFIPATLTEALWRPFAIMIPAPMVQEELLAPDLRYAVVMALGAAMLLWWAWRRVTRPSAMGSPRGLTGTARPLAALGCGLALDWVLWLTASGNGRYFLPMACITAVIIAALLFRIGLEHPKVRNYVLISILAVQIVQLSMGTQFRWNAVPWSSRWLDVVVPHELATEPNLYLTMGTQSNSFLAPFLARQSGLINFSGGYALAPDGPGGDRVEGLIARYAPHLRVLLHGRRLYTAQERREPNRVQIDDALERFGLRVNTADCQTIAAHGLPPELEITLIGDKNNKPQPQPRDTAYFLSCGIVQSDADRAVQIQQQRAADLVLDRLEDACPKLFQPRRMITEHHGDDWQRLYINTDLTAWVSHGWVKFRNPAHGDEMVYVGRESDWQKAPLRLVCGRRDGRYFATVLQSGRQP
jgi:hypothetical protein